LSPCRPLLRRRVAWLALAVGLQSCFAWAEPPAVQPQPQPQPQPLTRAQAASQARWAATLAEFAAADRVAPPAAGGVLFVGSSSIRLWRELPQDFNQAPLVINRGFGGSTMADCRDFAPQLVVQYRPRHVLVYAGENDLDQGHSPEDVLASFRGFVEVVRRELPATRISYISIKPSPLRRAMLPKVRQANMLLADYVNTLPDASFIDVFTPMIDGEGQPRAELFGPDRLHMNRTGYALWRSVIASHVVAAQTPSVGAAAAEAAPARPAGVR
jgi:lysophospholipase L1-like esterase